MAVWSRMLGQKSSSRRVKEADHFMTDRKQREKIGLETMYALQSHTLRVLFIPASPHPLKFLELSKINSPSRNQTFHTRAYRRTQY